MATQADDDFLEEAMIACAVASITVVMMRRRRKRRNRTIWTRDILLRRSEQGAYHNLIRELEDMEGLWQYVYNATTLQPVHTTW